MDKTNITLNNVFQQSNFSSSKTIFSILRWNCFSKGLFRHFFLKLFRKKTSDCFGFLGILIDRRCQEVKILRIDLYLKIIFLKKYYVGFFHRFLFQQISSCIPSNMFNFVFFASKWAKEKRKKGFIKDVPNFSTLFLLTQPAEVVPVKLKELESFLIAEVSLMNVLDFYCLNRNTEGKENHQVLILSSRIWSFFIKISKNKILVEETLFLIIS